MTRPDGVGGLWPDPVQLGGPLQRQVTLTETAYPTHAGPDQARAEMQLAQAAVVRAWSATVLVVTVQLAAAVLVLAVLVALLRAVLR